MGHGTFSHQAYRDLSESRSYGKLSAREIFNQDLDIEMSPKGVRLRESRDSDEHPTSLAIQIWLDVTGSMDRIPENLVKESLPHLMTDIINAGIEHPQIFFGAVGDHLYDRASLQIGQFESSTELVTKWLTSVFLEHGGGGNMHESYLLPWYFAAKHTSIDCFEKRGEKGFLFTIGDEKCHKTVTGSFLKNAVGVGEYKNVYTREELLEEAKRCYNVFHIHANDGNYRNNADVNADWRSLLGENYVIVENHKDIAGTIASIIKSHSVGVVNTGLVDAIVTNTGDEML